MSQTLDKPQQPDGQANAASDAFSNVLAPFGGRPAFDEPLHVGRPNIGDRRAFESRVSDILDRRWLTNSGRYAQEFEQRVAEIVGTKHCIATCNGTVALEIAIRALGLTGEVIIPSFTFIATAHALQWQEIQPVFCDIDPNTHNIDPACVEALITPRTTGMLGVHLWGRPCDTESLQVIADRYNLKLLFDAAHALGCSHRGQFIGTFGDAEVLSFHATKFVNSSEGGAVVTNNDSLAEKMRLMTNFGFAGMDHVIHVGMNGKMPEVCAAMGLTSLESMHEFINVNRANYDVYRDEFAALPGITLMEYDSAEQCNYQYIVVDVEEDETGLSRDELVQVLHAENVRARRYFWPGCHRMEPYRSLYPNSHLWLPNTEFIASRVIVLPTGSAVTHDHIRTICSILRAALAEAHRVRQALNRLPAHVPDVRKERKPR